jgi:hypothetical protein
MGLFFFFSEDLHDVESSRADKVICDVRGYSMLFAI